MILPQKHLKLSESLFAIGGYILGILKEPLTVDELWVKFHNVIILSNPEINCSFDKFILSIDYLFVINLIDANEKGEIYGIN